MFSKYSRCNTFTLNVHSLYEWILISSLGQQFFASWSSFWKWQQGLHALVKTLRCGVIDKGSETWCCVTMRLKYNVGVHVWMQKWGAPIRVNVRIVQIHLGKVFVCGKRKRNERGNHHHQQNKYRETSFAKERGIEDLSVELLLHKFHDFTLDSLWTVTFFNGLKNRDFPVDWRFFSPPCSIYHSLVRIKNKINTTSKWHLLWCTSVTGRALGVFMLLTPELLSQHEWYMEIPDLVWTCSSVIIIICLFIGLKNEGGEEHDAWLMMMHKS